MFVKILEQTPGLFVICLQGKMGYDRFDGYDQGSGQGLGQRTARQMGEILEDGQSYVLTAVVSCHIGDKAEELGLTGVGIAGKQTRERAIVVP